MAFLDVNLLAYSELHKRFQEIIEMMKIEADQIKYLLENLWKDKLLSVTFTYDPHQISIDKKVQAKYQINKPKKEYCLCLKFFDWEDANVLSFVEKEKSTDKDIIIEIPLHLITALNPVKNHLVKNPEKK